ncbi:MAG: hypothetical protein AAGF94_12120 [Pseudomonadota bacterium]
MSDEKEEERLAQRDALIWQRVWRGFSRTKPDVTDDEVAYFSAHPEEIEAAVAPGRIHQWFLLLGSAAGFLLLVVSKLIDYLRLTEWLGEFLNELIVDLLFEVGVALIGAAVTAYLLGVLLVVQQKNARIWRQELRRQIEEKKVADD